MTFWHPFLMLFADTPKSHNQHEALCNIVIFTLSGIHFPIIFSLIFHLFSGTAPGWIFTGLGILFGAILDPFLVHLGIIFGTFSVLIFASFF